MRQLKKGPSPQSLIENGDSWASIYTSASEQDRRQHERWRRADIRDALKSETGGLCAYCESKVDDVAFEHVEHIRPKKKFPQLAHDWNNLTSVCPRCNTYKGDYYEDDCELLNPYVDQVEERLQFRGPMIQPALGDDRAFVSVTKIRLDRMELAQSRHERLNGVHLLVRAWHEAAGAKRQALLEALWLDAEEGAYVACVRAYLADIGVPESEPQA